MKKLLIDNKYIFLLVITSLLFLFPLYHGFYLSHDGEAHVARFASYYKAFADGQFPPRWAENLNSGYGSPLFIFFYPLPGYIASFLHLFKIDFETIYRIIMIVSFTLSPIFLFIWLKSFAKKEVSFVVSFAYLVLPYRLLDTFVRGDIAEMLSFVFIPLVFLFIDKAKRDKKIIPMLVGGICYALLICAHNAIAFIFTPVFFLYAIIFAKKPKDFLSSCGILLIGILISAFFWLPSITDTKYVYSNILVVNVYKVNFIPLLHLFYSSWGFGPDVNVNGGLSPQIGILYCIISLLSLITLFKTEKKKEIGFWFFIFIAAAFMTTPYSRLLWEKLPIIKLMGYPWRFTSLSGFAACMLLFYMLAYINKKYFVAIVLLFLLFSIPFVKVKGYVPKKSDSFYFTYKGTTDYHMRTMTVWVAGDFWQTAKKQVEIIAGKGTITNVVKKSNQHTFETKSNKDMVIMDNTVYFPGWMAYVDGKPATIEFQDIRHRGLITFPVSKGKHKVAVIFKETRIRLFTDIISLLSLLVVIFGIIMRNKFFLKLKHP